MFAKYYLINVLDLAKKNLKKPNKSNRKKYLIYAKLNLYSNQPANTGKPIVAVLINAPAKIIKGSNGYFLIISF